MSDQNQTPATETPKTAQDQSQPSIGGLGIGTIVSLVASLAGGALGAGWPGVIALGLTAFAGVFGINMLIKSVNKRVDARDNTEAGADSGETAVDMANQASGNRHDIDDLRSQIPKPPAQ